MDPRLRHPFTCLISGPTQSGKTYFVNQCLEQLNDIMVPLPQDIIWCYGVWQNLYEKLQRRGVIFHEGLIDMTSFKGDKRCLLIIDDLMSETTEKVTQLFTKGSHHLNISVIYIVQNLFGKNKEQRTISLNSHYLVIFKNPRDASQITTLAKQMYPGKTQFLLEAYKDAVSKPNGYLLVDLRQRTPENLRLRSNIFEKQGITVYVPK